MGICFSAVLEVVSRATVRDDRRKIRSGAVRPVDVPVANPTLLLGLRKLLESSGYIDLGPEFDEASVPADSRLGMLVQMFGVGEALDVEEAISALAPLKVDRLVKAGLVRLQGKRLEPRIYIQTHGRLLFAVPIDESPKERTVMLVSPSSRALGKAMVRRPSRNTLDLGTGCGVLALAAAGYSEKVSAVDINPRAIEFSEFNCQLNQVRNVTCLQGSCFEPVRGQKFDLIVTNPPFVLSPASRLMYRDSGRDGDAFCIDLARDAARMLNVGGYFEMVFQWIQRADGRWQEELTQSFAGIGCDLWILRGENDSPDGHIRKSITESDTKAQYSRWREYLARRKAASVGTGFCIMKRISGRAPRIWFDELPDECSEQYGDAIDRIFAIRERIEEQSDAEFVRERLSASPSLRLVQESRRTGGDWQVAASELILESGLKYSFGDVDAVLGDLAAGCDGKRTLQEVFEGVAAAHQLPTENVISNKLPLVRDLARYGFLIPRNLTSSH